MSMVPKFRLAVGSDLKEIVSHYIICLHYIKLILRQSIVQSCLKGWTVKKHVNHKNNLIIWHQLTVLIFKITFMQPLISASYEIDFIVGRPYKMHQLSDVHICSDVWQTALLKWTNNCFRFIDVCLWLADVKVY